jgi:hypothetical protein
MDTSSENSFLFSAPIPKSSIEVCKAPFGIRGIIPGVQVDPAPVRLSGIPPAGEFGEYVRGGFGGSIPAEEAIKSFKDVFVIRRLIPEGRSDVRKGRDKYSRDPAFFEEVKNPAMETFRLSFRAQAVRPGSGPVRII